MRRMPLLLVATLMLSVLMPGVATAQEVTVQLDDTATIVDGGSAALIDVTVSCPKKWDVLEAFVYITQDGHTSQFGGIPIRKCKSKPRTYTVLVRAFDESPFHEGAANATAYVLVERGGETQSGGDGRPITMQ